MERASAKNSSRNLVRNSNGRGNLGLRLLSLAPPAAAQQIHCGPQFEQGIVGGLDTIDAGNRVEDDLSLLCFVIRHLRGQSHATETDQRPVLWPVDGRVIHDVALTGKLY